MDCCKKEEDCCPCDKLQERIECLQAQINQLTDITESTNKDISGIVKVLVHKGIIQKIPTTK